MQIIIPMSGFGERFRRKGYRVPKPLIEIGGKPIIAHVIDMFPGETDFLFICNQDHLSEPSYQMRDILEKLCPTGRIIGIPAHKYGPVYAVLQAAQYIHIASPVVVNYCDFTCYWDWSYFKQWVLASQCEGAVPAYKGFHPHTLGTVNYAYMREQNGWMLAIQEKKPYTDNRMNEYASSGTYYFSNGQVMLDAFRETIERDLNVGGEYYVSLAYQRLLANNRPVAIYDLQHFMQWGTPEDVAEYCQWSETFRRLNDLKIDQDGHGGGGTVVIPMAGLGQRYAREGYTMTKPLIPVSGRPMVVQAAYDLPQADRYVFIQRVDMPGFEVISDTLRQAFPHVLVDGVPKVTEGQACTAIRGLDALTEKWGAETLGSVTFGTCDHGVLYDQAKLGRLLAEENTDIIVWVVRGHTNAIRHPEMYGWIVAEGDVIKHVSVKAPLFSPETDPMVLGTFTFKRAEDFRRCVERLMWRDGRVNGEFYIDTCINDALALGLNCKLFEVDSYISWGTPNDLRTFEYWQSCFHKWAGHPYRMELDSRIPTDQLEVLALRYQATIPNFLEVQH